MNTPIKCCIICNKSKPITEFSKRDAQTYRGYCLVCNRARQLKDYYKHIKKRKKTRKAHYRDNRDKILARFHTPEYKKYKKEYDRKPEIVQRHIEYERSRHGKQIRNKYRKTYRRKLSVIKYNRSEKGRATKKRLDNEFKKTIRGKILCCLRRRLLTALRIKGIRKHYSTRALLGCTVSEFKAYLESKFKIGMTWDNHGNKGWHMDHIIPCASFDLSDPEQQKKCFHYSNIQPMWWKDNMSKGKRT